MAGRIIFPILIDALLGKKETVDFIEKIEDREILKTTTISIYEISRGIKKDNEVRKVKDLFDSLIVLNFTKRDAFQAGKIERELKKHGILTKFLPNTYQSCLILLLFHLNLMRSLTLSCQEHQTNLQDKLSHHISCKDSRRFFLALLF